MNFDRFFLPGLFLTFQCAAVMAESGTGLLIADFESEGFGSWKTTGRAFGDAPARAAVDGQMEVKGFEGKSFANSYHGGDDAVGTLTSPEFRIERKFINFLIGGGKNPEETCINLIVGGKVVRTATGPNDRPGGSERLEWATWETSELIGKNATLEIVDKRKGGWGHINVDQILQSDLPEQIDARLELTVNKRYLIWPVAANSRDKQRVFMTLDGGEQPFCFNDISLSENPDFWTFTDLANHQGRRLTVRAMIPRRHAEAWKKVVLSDTFPGEENLYQEPLRPQFHFTSRRGWLNDPNGLVYKDGIWHLFYQHNPYNSIWDNMHWGHATSKDLIHWKEGPDALFPEAEGVMYSGSGFIVPQGKSGLPTTGGESIVLAYTAEGTRSYVPGKRTEQALAFSRDGGKTFTKFQGNPVLPHVAGENRDPKVFWHAPTKRWVMALYLDGPDYGIFTSPDLVTWKQTQTYQIPGDTECPDLFPLAADGDSNKTRWVVWGANGRYLVGDFDGEKFTAQGGVKRHYFGAAYAGQSYDNAPDGRRVHFGWMRGEGAFPGAPFNLQMTLPMDFTLRSEGSELRLNAEPSPEVATLRKSTKEWKDLVFREGGDDPLDSFKEELFEVEAVISADTDAKHIGLRLFDEYPVLWETATGLFTDMEGKQEPIDGKLHLRVFVDRASVEVFLNGTYHGRYIRRSPEKRALRLVADGGSMKLHSLKIHTLRSAWE